MCYLLDQNFFFFILKNILRNIYLFAIFHFIVYVYRHYVS